VIPTGTFAWLDDRNRVEVVRHLDSGLVEVLARCATKTQVVPDNRLSLHKRRPGHHMPEPSPEPGTDHSTFSQFPS
jgi:hypothetical protein